MSATISTEDLEVVEAAALVRDGLGFPPDTPPEAIIRYCVLSTAEYVRHLLAAREEGKLQPH